ncbi:uncharacterized protein LOC110852714 [Folsomia candida]|uniref:Uncharacterized protein n=1 Tax=Folsomia candida TaxID=158441 RepID=A0A226E4P8_FOLCA|nr:uncharacterized protein LOC110852714 [Folsomia candida]OXA52004.1 hypothetical protein Fcan01_13833 [Folsomia candida]
MDNSLVHIPVRSFLNAICKVVIADLIAYLAKFGWGLYYVLIGIRDKLQHKEYDGSNPDPLLSFILGTSVLIGVLFRYISNYFLYKDSAFTLETQTQRVRHFFCTRCCATSRTWITIAFLNMGISIIIAAVLGQFSLGPGIIFIIWEVVIILVVGFLKIFVYRYFISVENRNLVRSDSVVSSIA